MKLTSDNETLAKDKALILYILNKVAEPITNSALLELVLATQNMNYFYFQQFLLDLIEKKYIITYLKEKDSFYEITDLGKSTLKLVEDLIPGILKFNIDNSFKHDLQKIEDTCSITADFIPNEDVGYTVNLKIIEHNNVLFDLKVFAGSREQAKTLVDNWQRDAITIYPQILELISK